MIHVSPSIQLQEGELHEQFIRASGPGGQNVNKVASAVQLRFDVANSPSLSEGVRTRLRKLAGRRMTAQGVLTIDARRFRTLERNRRDALERLVALIRAAEVIPKTRKKTRPTLGAKRRRLNDKSHTGRVKRLRGGVHSDHE